MKLDDYIRLIDEESKELDRLEPIDSNSIIDSNTVKELEEFFSKYLERHNALADEPLEL
jgi:hypothetical protein